MTARNDFASLLADPWRQSVPITAPLQMPLDARDPTTYQRTVDQFEVATSRRYAPRDGLTLCNIFAWDISRACGVEVPHWVTPTGRIGSPGAGNHEIQANDLPAWLSAHAQDGWRSTLFEREAKRIANTGTPVFALWRNTSGHGHIAVVIPSQEIGPMMISQAGSTCHARYTLERGFGKHAAEVVFWFNR